MYQVFCRCGLYCTKVLWEWAELVKVSEEAEFLKYFLQEWSGLIKVSEKAVRTDQTYVNRQRFCRRDQDWSKFPQENLETLNIT